MLKLILCLLTVLSFATVAYAKDAPQMSVPFPLGRDISDHFVGTVHRNDIIMADDVYKLPQTNVITFEPGSHSGWHVHGAMTIIGLAGTGVYQEWGKPAVLIRQGDVVQIPAGTSHWHGAAPGSKFAHIAISPEDNHEVTWYDFPMKEYVALEDLSKQAEQVENPVKTTQNEAALYKDRR